MLSNGRYVDVDQSSVARYRDTPGARASIWCEFGIRLYMILYENFEKKM